jgi:inositol oxygenase
MDPAGDASPKATPPLAGGAPKQRAAFRNFDLQARASVRELYRLNHAGQTYDFVRRKKQEFLTRDRRAMGIWEAMEALESFVDDSDPDTELSQIEHNLQTAEAIRRDGHPRWLILTGLIHDLGKLLYLYGEPQWAVVGDTFPVGCAWSEKIVFHELFEANPDSRNPAYQTRCGVYQEGCGLDRVQMSWGHDEYLYHVVEDYLPPEALAIIRYHSFYPWHQEGEYLHLTDERDRERLHWVRVFNGYDLYSKSDEPPDPAALRPFYEELIAEHFPPRLRW